MKACIYREQTMCLHPNYGSGEFLFQPVLITNMKLEYEPVESLLPQT
jgi:hypothetical protein